MTGPETLTVALVVHKEQHQVIRLLYIDIGMLHRLVANTVDMEQEYLTFSKEIWYKKTIIIINPHPTLVV